MANPDALHLHELHTLNWGNTAPSPVPFSAVGGLQLVLGPNEAGKTTLMRAIRGFVRGLLNSDPAPRLLPDAEVKARVQLHGTERWLVRRGRDGAGAPLRDGAGTVMPPDLCWPAPSPVVYDALFCLDHDTLRDGGRQLGRSDTGELGTLLFATLADAGRLAKVKKDSDQLLSSLFNPAGQASKPLVNKAIRGFTEGEKVLKEAEITHAKHGQRKRNLAKAEAALRKAEEAWSAANVAVDTLGTLLTQLPSLTQLRTNEAQQAAVKEEGPTPPAAWAANAQAVQEALRAAHATQQTAGSQLTDRREALAAVVVDETLLARADDIRAAHGLLAGFTEARDALPAARVALDTALPAWQGALRVLDMDPDADGSSALLPTETDLAELQAALSELTPVLAAESEARAAVERAEAALAATTAEWDPAAPAPQASPSLVEALAAARQDQADEADRAARAAEQARQAEGLLQDARALRLACAATEELRGLALPSLARRQELSGQLQACEQAVQASRDRTKQLGAEREALEAELREGNRSGTAPSSAALQALRDARDTALQAAWADPSVPQGAAWKAVAEADLAADQRYQEAEAVGALEARLAQLDRLQGQEQESDTALQAAQAARTALDTAWAREAAELGLPDLSLTELSAWVDAVQDLKNQEANLRTAREALANETSRTAASLAHLRSVLEPLQAGSAPTPTDAPSALLDAAERVRGQLAEAVAAHQEQRAAWQAAQNTLQAATAHHTAAAAACAVPQARWTTAKAPFDTPGSITPDGAPVWLAQLTAARSASLDLAGAQETVDQLESRVAGFQSAAEPLEDLADPHLPADARVRWLHQQLEHETLQATERSRCTQERDRAKAALDTAAAATTAAQDALDLIVKEGNLGGPEAVDAARDRAGRLEALEAQATVLRAALGETPPDRIEAQVAGRAQVALQADRAAADDARKARDQERTAAREGVRTAQAAFDAVDGTAVAAEAAQARADHQSAAQEAVEQLLLERACAYLTAQLQDELAREAQTGPVDRAGEVFSTLTLGAFQGLQVEQRDEGGTPLRYVSGLRSNGERVAPREMSDGTRDALWLSLRVAAIEDLLDKGHRVPVVLDDVAVHLDDARTRAMLQVFGELAQKTQVLLFTHHRSVVEAAAAAGVPHETLELGPRSPDAPPMNLNPPDPGPRPAAGAATAPTPRPRAPRRAAAPAVDLSPILAHLEDHPEGCGKRALVEAGLVEEADWTRLRSALDDSPRIRVEGQRRGRRYLLVE